MFVRDAAGVHGRDADAVRRELLAQRVAEPAHRELAGDVRRLPGRADDPEQARHVDHVRPLRRDEARQQRVRHEDDGVQVDREHPVDVVEADLVEPAAQRDAGVVHQQVQVGVVVADGLRHGQRGVAVREVDDVRRHLPVAARGAQLGGDGLEPGRVAVEQDEVAAARRELARGRASDPARGAREDCRASVDDVPLHVRASVIRGARAKRTPSSSSVPRVSSRTSLR